MTEPEDLMRLADDGNPHVDPITAPDHGEYDAETVRLVTAAEREVGVCERELDSFKAMVGEAKKTLEARVIELRKLIRDRQTDRGTTPAPSILDMTDAPAAVVPEDLWRAYPIERWARYGISAKDVERLAAGEVKKAGERFPITTVGDLSNFSKPSPSGWVNGYADIKGIGAAGADRISDAEAQFWSWWGGGGDVEYARERGLTHGAAGVSGGHGAGAARAVGDERGP